MKELHDDPPVNGTSAKPGKCGGRETPVPASGTYPFKIHHRNASGDEGTVLIVGGAGFIGTNLAHRLLTAQRPVLIFDNLSRAGVVDHLYWLRSLHGELLRIEIGDVRDGAAVKKLIHSARPSQVFDLAAQVAVTTSLSDPVHDFEVNARGTLNLLEALRSLDNPVPLVFTSTNKVYGHLKDVPLQVSQHRYEPVDPQQRLYGFNESRPLSFHSPYGCSKGAAEQYVLDYSHTFGLPTVVFRMSCIYGPHQVGTEDQGWVAHFLIRALQGQTIRIFGDGMQVRDILYVEDLLDALLLAQRHVHSLAGQAFNIGGGRDHSVSLLELTDLLGELLPDRPRLAFDSWRVADQRFYVSDIRRFANATGWAPRVGPREGLAKLCHWMKEQRTEVHPFVLVQPRPAPLASVAKPAAAQLSAEYTFR
jgi:CDP-paratose 2-epimerase